MREGEKETETDQLTPLKDWIIIFRLVKIPVSSFKVDVPNLAVICHDLY